LTLIKKKNKNAEIIEVRRNTKAIKRLLGGIEDFEDCKILQAWGVGVEKAPVFRAGRSHSPHRISG